MVERAIPCAAHFGRRHRDQQRAPRTLARYPCDAGDCRCWRLRRATFHFHDGLVGRRDDRRERMRFQSTLLLRRSKRRRSRTRAMEWRRPSAGTVDQREGQRCCRTWREAKISCDVSGVSLRVWDLGAVQRRFGNRNGSRPPLQTLQSPTTTYPATRFCPQAPCRTTCHLPTLRTRNRNRKSTTAIPWSESRSLAIQKWLLRRESKTFACTNEVCALQSRMGDQPRRRNNYSRDPGALSVGTTNSFRWRTSRVGTTRVSLGLQARGILTRENTELPAPK